MSRVRDDMSQKFQEGYQPHHNLDGRRFGARVGRNGRENRRGFDREFVRTFRENERF